MTRVMGDSTVMSAIPLTVNIAAVYDDGHLGVETEAQLAARFPRDKYGHVFIDVTGAMPQADVRDWENGDKGGSLQQWVIDHNAHAGKKNAVIYTNISTIPEVRQLTGTQILGTDYFLWVATLDGTVVAPGPVHLDAAPRTYPGVVANQVKGAQLTGGDWDLSVVYDGTLWLPVAPPKPPAPRVTRAQAQAAASSIAGALGVLTVAIPELPE